MYQNVIVPFDGSLPARAALAPGADLAWRCGGRVVIVNNTEANDAASRDVLKSRAMSMSGADVDFWVDVGGSVGRALVEAAKYRDDPIICIPVRSKTTGLRRKPVVSAVAAEVLRDSPAPVLVIGPETDVSRGLTMGTVVVALDGSAASEMALPTAVTFARGLKARVALVGVVREGTGGEESHQAEAAYLRGHRDRMASEGLDVRHELIEAVDPVTGLVERLRREDDAIVVLSTHGRSGVDDTPLGSVAQGVLLRSPRAMVFVRPRP